MPLSAGAAPAAADRPDNERPDTAPRLSTEDEAPAPLSEAFERPYLSCKEERELPGA
jgi:hypothetical protein